MAASAIMVSNAQDVIITNNDEMIKVYNVEIGKNAVFYQTSQDADAPILKMPKSEIFMIKMQDGRKVDPNASEEVVNTTAGNQNDKPVNLQNQQMISDWNKMIYELPNQDSKKNAKHNPLFVKLGVKQNSQLCNEDLTLRYSMTLKEGYTRYKEYRDVQDKISLRKYLLSIHVTNNTSRMLYIDMSQSFFTGKLKVQSMYSGKVVTNTNAEATGLGFGIIGGASASAQTTTITEQRIISIPPKSTITLPYNIQDPLAILGPILGMLEYDSKMDEIAFANPLKECSVQMLTDMVAGESKEFEENDQKSEMYILLTYSDNEEIKNAKVIRTDFYLQQILKLKSCSSGIFSNNSFGIPQIVPQDCNYVWFITCDYYNGGGFTKYEKYSNKP